MRFRRCLWPAWQISSRCEAKRSVYLSNPNRALTAWRALSPSRRRSEGSPAATNRFPHALPVTRWHHHARHVVLDHVSIPPVAITTTAIAIASRMTVIPAPKSFGTSGSTTTLACSYVSRTVECAYISRMVDGSAKPTLKLAGHSCGWSWRAEGEERLPAATRTRTASWPRGSASSCSPGAPVPRKPSLHQAVAAPPSRGPAKDQASFQWLVIQGWTSRGAQCRDAPPSRRYSGHGRRP